MKNTEITQVIYKWFGMKYETYDKLEHNGSIYLYYKGETNPEIRIDIKNKHLYFIWNVYIEFSQIISVEINDFKPGICKWVEDTFNLTGVVSTGGKRIPEE